MSNGQTETKCKNCGAPIKYVAGENVLHCDYCGGTTMIAALDNIVKLDEHFIIPNTQSEGAIQQFCRKWMGEGFFKAGDLAHAASFSKVEGIYLPFWVVNAQVNTFWSGMNRRTRTVGSGNNRRSETYYEPANGTINEKVGWVVYARSNMEEYWGLAALNPGGQAAHADWGGFSLGMGMGNKTSEGVDLTTGKVPFNAEVAQGVKIVNGQITQDQANERAKSQIIQYHRKKAEGAVNQLQNCQTTTIMERTELIYAPVYFVDYGYKGKTYHMVAEGNKGRIITGEAPVGKWDKVAVSGGIGGVVALGCGLAATFIDAPWAPYLYIGTAISIIAVGIHAIKASMTE